jgi:hypothetical protein
LIPESLKKPTNPWYVLRHPRDDGWMDGWATAKIAADFMSKVRGEVIHKLFQTSEKSINKPVKICIIL